MGDVLLHVPGPYCCTDADHALITSDEQRFEAGCDNIRPWPGEPMVVGECCVCHSTLSMQVDTEDCPAQRRGEGEADG